MKLGDFVEDHDFHDKAKKYLDTKYLDTMVKKFVENEPHILFYLVPANSLDIRTIYPIDLVEKDKLRPICGSNYTHKSQSYILATGTPHGSKPRCSTELKENGVIEAADLSILNNDKTFSSQQFKIKILASIKEYLDILIDVLNVETPIYFSLALNGVDGYKFGNTDRIIQKKNQVYSNIIHDRSEIDELISRLVARISSEFI